jgi:hypothetical protein
MATLLAFPILGLLIILQSAVVSRIPLLHGTADLVLIALLAWAVQERVSTAWQWSILGGILVSMVTALPLVAVLLGYLLATGVALLLRHRVWQVRILALLIATFFGTLITHTVTVAYLRLSGTSIPLVEAFNVITLPSALLNLLVAVPMYPFIADLAHWLYPEEIEL